MSKYGAKARDLTGERFGKLVVLHRGENKDYGYISKVTWVCRCDCGKIACKTADHLTSGNTTSCGCAKMEQGKRRSESYPAHWKNLRVRYSNMVKRCCDKNDREYRHYGERGIKIEPIWLGENGFMNFYEWSINNGFDPSLTIDRIDNNGNYGPDNCRWVSNVVNQNNKRNNVRVEANGEEHTRAEWSRILGVSYEKIRRASSPQKVIERLIYEKEHPDEGNQDPENGANANCEDPVEPTKPELPPWEKRQEERRELERLASKFGVKFMPYDRKGVRVRRYLGRLPEEEYNEMNQEKPKER